MASATSEPVRPADVRKERAAKGLCPYCGKLAAPYYLCDRHHRVAQLRRFFRALEKQDLVEITVDPADKRRILVMAKPSLGTTEVNYGKSLDIGERGNPRIRGGVPADVTKELVGILRRQGRPMREEEIAAAWVKLRPKPGQTNAAAGMAAMIKAQDKRARKMARNRALRAKLDDQRLEVE